MDTELRPCPFCGSEAKKSGYGLRGCTSCNLFMLAEMWNRRAPRFTDGEREAITRIQNEIDDPSKWFTHFGVYDSISIPVATLELWRRTIQEILAG